MSAKLQYSWTMIKASAQVLRSDKELLVFPFISGFVVLLISAMFAYPLFSSGIPKEGFTIYDPSTLPFLALYYFLTYFIIIFFNTALVGAAMIRLNGGNPTLGDGIKIATSRISAILGYSLLSMTVGMLLRWLQENLGFLGKLFAFLSSLAWSVVTFLVVPVLAVEGIGPIEAVKRSSVLLKKTWGEQLIGNIGIGLFFGLVVLGLSLVFIPLAVFTTINQMHTATIFIGVLAAICISIIVIISSTLTSIYTAALYKYATEGSAGDGFSKSLLMNSFTLK